MARAKIKLISRGMRALLTDPGVGADLERRAGRVAATARATAPVDTGAYRDSIGVETDVTDRVVARVVARDPKSHIIEARTGNLSRALDSAGGA